MKKKIRVVITGEDFVSSNYGSNSDCALAKALKRTINDSHPIGVGGNSLYIIVNDEKIWYVIPRKHQYTIRDRCYNNINKDLVIVLTKEVN